MTGPGLPYPGLRAFAREESHLFFGREGCVDAMIERLAATRFLAVLGASGSGKSSLVRTGLLDGLELGFYARAGARWTIIDLHPGSQPMRNLAAGLAAVSLDAPEPVDVEVLRALVARGPRSIVEWCVAGGLKEGHNLLILVDQFEELFRYGDHAAREEAEAFVALLLESAQAAEAPIHVVLTMRSEYLGACALISGLAEQINAGFYLTPRMSPQECRLAIEGPASVCGFSIAPALVNRVLNDMADFAPWEEQTGLQQSLMLSRRADQLPLMQHLLNRLWLGARRRAGGGPVKLTLDDYLAAKGLAGALDVHGQEVLDSLAPEDRADAATLFRALVSGPDPTNAVRRPSRFGALAAEVNGDPDAARRIVGRFRAADCQFLQPAADVPLDDDTVVDISHESLIRQWSTLAEWLRNEARADANWRRILMGVDRRSTGESGLLSGLDLTSLAAWWDRERPTSIWASRHGGKYPEAAAYLSDSRDAEAAERKVAGARAANERVRLYSGVLVLAVLLLVASGTSLWGFVAHRTLDKHYGILFQKNEILIETEKRLGVSVAETKRKNEELRQRNTALGAEKKKNLRLLIRANSAATQAHRQEMAAKAARDSARNAELQARTDAQIYATALNRMLDVLGGPHSRQVGLASLQTDLLNEMAPALDQLGGKHEGVVSPMMRARTRSALATTLATAGQAARASEVRSEAFQDGLEALKRIGPGAADYNALAAEVLSMGYWHGWSLFDAGNDAEGTRVLEEMDAIAVHFTGPHGYDAAPAVLILPLAQYERLKKRRYNELGQSESRDASNQRAKALAQRGDAPAEDRPELDRVLANALLETPQTGAELAELRDRACELIKHNYEEAPLDRSLIGSMVRCNMRAARRHHAESEDIEADERVAEAKSLLDAALWVEPKGNLLLLTQSEFLLDWADLAENRGDESLADQYRKEAADSFIKALKEQSVEQRYTNVIRDLYVRFGEGELPSSPQRVLAELPKAFSSVAQHVGQAQGDTALRPVVAPDPAPPLPASYYERFIDAVRRNRRDFPDAPSYAAVEGLASTRLAVERLRERRPDEAERYLGDAITAFTEGRVLERISGFSVLTARVCDAWGQKVRLLAEGRRVDEAVQAYQEMRAKCEPALDRHPWDYYLRVPLKIAAMRIGRLLYEGRRFDQARPPLEFASEWGDKESSGLLAEIYRNGWSVSADGARADQLDKLAERQSTIRFRIPADFGGLEFPVTIYVGEYASTVPYQHIEDQVVWLRRVRGAVVPDRVIKDFDGIRRLAKENDVAFPEAVAIIFAGSEDEPDSERPNP